MRAGSALLVVAVAGLLACERGGSPIAPDAGAPVTPSADVSTTPRDVRSPTAPASEIVAPRPDVGAELAPVERCNALDDDGDGATDEEWPAAGAPCDGDDADACAAGVLACDPAGSGLECRGDVARAEECNGRDDDCDGATDEELADPDGDGVRDCPDYTKAPVLMVHGYLAGPDFTWVTMRDRLVADGWPPEYLWNPGFEDVTGCNPQHGEEIAEWVRQLRARTGRERVDILAHSMGGLDTRYYLKHLCGTLYVEDVVTVAGAHHGSWVGCIVPGETCGARDLCRGRDADDWRENEFLAALADCDETPGDEVLYTSIWSAGDEIIVPAESSLLDGARNIQVAAAVGHAGIFIEDEPYGFVKQGLDRGGYNANALPPDAECYTPCRYLSAPRSAR